jgi:hypothetical protein
MPTWRAFTRTPPGTPIKARVPLNLLSPAGRVRMDSASSLAYTADGSGGLPQEQVLAFHPGSLSDTSPVQPYDTAILQSVQTGQWCRLATNPANTTQVGVRCDLVTASTATTFTYQGDGLSYQGMDLVAVGPGQLLLLDNTTAVPVNGPTADNLALVLAPVGESPDRRVNPCALVVHRGARGRRPHACASHTLRITNLLCCRSERYARHTPQPGHNFQGLCAHRSPRRGHLHQQRHWCALLRRRWSCSCRSAATCAISTPGGTAAGPR